MNLTSVAYIISHITHSHAICTEHINHMIHLVIYDLLKGVSLLKTLREGNNSVEYILSVKAWLGLICGSTWLMKNFNSSFSSFSSWENIQKVEPYCGGLYCWACQLLASPLNRCIHGLQLLNNITTFNLWHFISVIKIL